MRLMIKIAAVLATLLLVVVERQGFVEAACCGAPCSGCERAAILCNDCTKATPYCGYVSCNIFGCNCGDTCRHGKGCNNCNCPSPPPPPLMAIGSSSSKPKCQRRETAVPSDAELEEQERQSVAHLQRIMATADADGDGRLTLREVQSWAKENLPTQYSKDHYVSSQFSKVDTDHDGFVTPQEIDP